MSMQGVHVCIDCVSAWAGYLYLCVNRLDVWVQNHIFIFMYSCFIGLKTSFKFIYVHLSS